VREYAKLSVRKVLSLMVLLARGFDISHDILLSRALSGLPMWLMGSTLKGFLNFLPPYLRRKRKPVHKPESTVAWAS
jgi:hypothetical protein